MMCFHTYASSRLVTELCPLLITEKPVPFIASPYALHVNGKCSTIIKHLLTFSNFYKKKKGLCNLLLVYPLAHNASSAEHNELV